MSVAGVAHPVERHLAKVEVASSSLVTRSNKKTTFVYQTNVVFLNDVCLAANDVGCANDVFFGNDAALLMFLGKHRIIAAKPQHHYAQHNIMLPTAIHH